jgi:hypothetical protein
MGQIFEGKFIYSLNDCRCRYCLHISESGACKLPRCCCLEEKREAIKYFPPDGLERKKRGGMPCPG